MNKSEKVTPIILIGVFIMLIIEMSIVTINNIDYEDRKEYGNARWEQVDEILSEYDSRIKNLEEICDGRHS